MWHLAVCFKQCIQIHYISCFEKSHDCKKKKFLEYKVLIFYVQFLFPISQLKFEEIEHLCNNNIVMKAKLVSEYITELELQTCGLNIATDGITQWFFLLKFYLVNRQKEGVNFLLFLSLFHVSS